MAAERAAERHHEAVEQELNQERAAVLGRVGRRVEAAIERCQALAPRADSGDVAALDAYRAERRVVLQAISDLCLQREMLGLLDHSRVPLTYPVPPPR